MINCQLFRFQSVLASTVADAAPVKVKLSEAEVTGKSSVLDVRHSVLRVVFRQTEECYEYWRKNANKCIIDNSILVC